MSVFEDFMIDQKVKDQSELHRLRSELDEMKAVLAWASENVHEAWKASLWAIQLRSSIASRADFTGHTLYEALVAAWRDSTKQKGEVNRE